MQAGLLPYLLQLIGAGADSSKEDIIHGAREVSKYTTLKKSVYIGSQINSRLVLLRYLSFFVPRHPCTCSPC